MSQGIVTAPRPRRRLPAGRPARRARLAPAGAHAVAALAILVVWAVSIRHIALREMTDVGLISVMPPLALVMLALLTASFCVALRGRPVQPWVALVHVVVLVVMLYGITAFVEAEPRFSSVYRHVGIIGKIIRDGSVDPSIDAYFDWPGFFSLGAVISRAMGVPAIDFAPWGALAFNLLYLPPLLVLFRWASDDRRVHWLAVWVFYCANWVGQDYLSPQATAFLLWLVMLGALLVWFTPAPVRRPYRSAVHSLRARFDLRHVRRRLQRESRLAAERPTPARRAGLVVLVLAMFAAMVSGHQLTPFPVTMTVAMLVLFAGLETRLLPVVMGVILAAWISYQTTAFLTGHINDIAGPLGSTASNLSQNVASRVTGSSGHSFVVQVRVLGSGAIWLAGLVGLVRRLRAGYADAALLVIGATPFILPVLQPYGGEMLLRVFLFALPVTAFLIANIAYPVPAGGRGAWTTAGVLAGCLVLLALFQVMRYGNERMDNFTRGDAATVAAFYRDAPVGATVYGANLPWRGRHYADYDYRSIFELPSWRRARHPDPAQVVADLEEDARTDRPAIYVLVTRSMRIEAELLHNQPGVLERVARTLNALPGARRLYATRDGELFRLAPLG